MNNLSGGSNKEGGEKSNDFLSSALGAEKQVKQAQTMKKISDMFPGSTSEKLAILNKINSASGGRVLETLGEIENSSSSQDEIITKLKGFLK